MKLLFNQYERTAINKYYGAWGFRIPDDVWFVVARYSVMKAKHEFIRSMKIPEIVNWLNKKLKEVK